MSDRGDVTHRSTETFRRMERRIVVLEQVCKEVAALLVEVPDFDSIDMDRDDWSARRGVLLKRIEQEVK